MILYSIVDPKLSDLHTLSHSKLLENHTLHSGTYLYSPYMAVPPLPSRGSTFHASRIIHIMGYGWVNTVSLHAADVRAYCLNVKRARLVVA